MSVLVLSVKNGIIASANNEDVIKTKVEFVTFINSETIYILLFTKLL